MIRVKKENHRSWFMSNYYPCEFVMNGIRYKNAEAAFQSHKVPLEERRQCGNAAAAGNTTAVRKATKRPMRSRKIMRPSANAGGRSFFAKNKNKT